MEVTHKFTSGQCELVTQNSGHSLPKPVPTQQPQPVTEVSTLPGFDVIVFGGLLMPQGTLRTHAKKSALFGLGIDKTFWRELPHSFRARFAVTSKAKLPPAQADRKGNLEIQLMTTRVDYMYGLGAYKPFVGVGVAQTMWQGTISKPSTAEQNSGKHNDFGATVNCGVDARITPTFVISPEFSYMSISGDFGEPLATGLLAFLWEI